MDLGIKGRKAIVCASSKGLGRACAMALAEAGCTVVVNGRDAALLASTARAIGEATGASVVEVAGDLDAPQTRAALIAACPEPDILVNNNGGPPAKPFASLSREDILKGIEANMLTPIALAQAFLPGMAARKFGRVVNITSSSVKAPLPGLDVSSGARAGLTAFLASSARAHAADNVTINAIQPGWFDTDRVRPVLQREAERRGVSVEAVRDERLRTVPARRMGDPAEFGALCAFLCSAPAAYITGQNILIDGGAFPGAF